MSESQERMLAAVVPDRIEHVARVCRKWGLDASVVARYTDGGRLVITSRGDEVGDVPAQALAERMGLEDPVFRMPQDEILTEMLRGSRGPVAALDPGRVRDAGPIRLAPEGGQQFRTPSGMLEFYSEALAAQGLPPMPDWQSDPEDERQAARWPLRLLTAPGYFQSHTAYSGVAYLRRREGAPCCILHPQEAGARGLHDGQRVRLLNDRGSIGLVLRISDEVQPGVVLVPGQRPEQSQQIREVKHESVCEVPAPGLCSNRHPERGLCRPDRPVPPLPPSVHHLQHQRADH